MATGPEAKKKVVLQGNDIREFALALIAGGHAGDLRAAVFSAARGLAELYATDERGYAYLEEASEGGVRLTSRDRSPLSGKVRVDF